MRKRSLMVIALGGNAISLPDQEGNVDQQFASSRATATALADLVLEGHQLVITHGNGPQIGNFLLRNLVAAGVIYPLPMEVAVAHVQGGMGYMIAQTMMNELSGRGHDCVVSSVVTTVEVDEADPSFANPDKPIGRRLTIDDARRLAREEGWTTKEVSPGTYRRVVPSPKPTRIVEIDCVRRAIDAGEMIVTCGGGGIPVIRDPKRGYCGVRAVIDKDRVSSLLAAEISADTLMILTNVDRVCVNYGKPDERGVESMTLAEANAWLDEGQFPAGSMGPKVEGAVRFVEAAKSIDARAIIGPLDRVSDAIAGRTGTVITKG